MWIEVTGKETGKKYLVNTDFVQCVYEADGGGVIITVGERDSFVVVGNYKDIRELVSEGEWTR